MAFGNGPYIITNGLVLALDAADRNSYVSGSTTWINLAGINNGTLVNGPTFDSGSGGSIVFDGVDDHATISGSTVPIGAGDYYVEAWVKRTTVPSNISVAILNGTTNNCFYFGFGRTYNGANGLRIGLSNVLDGENCAFSFVQNIWYHVAVLRISSVVYFYINGQQQTTQGSGTSNVSFLTSTLVRIGAGGSSTVLEPFYGNITSVKTYNRALSATEILQNYNATKSRFNL